MIHAETETGRLRAIDECFIGATRFEHPQRRVLDPAADRFLGTSDLFMKFEGGRRSRWGAALMEMLVDPLLSTWVPDWVTEQYERANPFFRDVLRGMRQRKLRNNAHLLQATRREMVRRHQRQLRKEAAKKAGAPGSASEASGCSDSGDAEANAQGDAALRKEESEPDAATDVEGPAVVIIRDPRPEAGGNAVEAEGGWDRRDAGERASAAGPAPPAMLRLLGDVPEAGSAGTRSRRPGLLLNPKNFPWTEQACNVHWSEHARLLSLQRQ